MLKKFPGIKKNLTHFKMALNNSETKYLYISVSKYTYILYEFIVPIWEILGNFNKFLGI